MLRGDKGCHFPLKKTAKTLEGYLDPKHVVTWKNFGDAERGCAGTAKGLGIGIEVDRLFPAANLGGEEIKILREVYHDLQLAPGEIDPKVGPGCPQEKKKAKTANFQRRERERSFGNEMWGGQKNEVPHKCRAHPG